VYVIGGYDGASNLSEVLYAPLNADGTVGAWKATTSMPAARNSPAATIYKGKIYITGGSVSGTATTDVLYAQIDAAKDISMSAWATTTQLGAGKGSASTQILTRSGPGSAVYNGYIYVVGG
jgi:hypothetical protein